MYVFLFLVLFPPADTEAIHQVVTRTAAFHRFLGAMGGALVDNGWFSLVLFGVFGIWCYLRRTLIELLLPVMLLIVLYVYTGGWPHFQGTIFIAILTALGLAWPGDDERREFHGIEVWAYRAMVAALAITISYQIYAAGIIIRNDFLLPYSGARDAAEFVKPEVAKGKIVYGYQYGMVGMSAYFDHNIFANWPRAYYHHSLSEFDPSEVRKQVGTGVPDFVVITWWEPWDETQFNTGLRSPMADLG
jgi:hypothetical protein